MSVRDAEIKITSLTDRQQPKYENFSPPVLYFIVSEVVCVLVKDWTTTVEYWVSSERFWATSSIREVKKRTSVKESVIILRFHGVISFQLFLPLSLLLLLILVSLLFQFCSLLWIQPCDGDTTMIQGLTQFTSLQIIRVVDQDIRRLVVELVLQRSGRL